MLRECVRLAREEQRVVVFLEPIALYPMRDLHEAGDNGWMCHYPAPNEVIPLGEVGINGGGTDLAIVTYGNGNYLSHKVQKRLTGQGVHTRIVDLRWLSPLPEDALIEAVADCKNILIVDECRRTGGPAEGLMSLFTERTRIPHARITSEDSFIATGPAYAATMPSAESIYDAAIALIGRVN
jgi:2-oxoisovalerate dehydrogenase E1 component